MKAPEKKLSRPYTALCVAFACAAALYFGHGKSLISVSWDPHEVNCLPELHLAILVHAKPQGISRDHYLFWRAAGALDYVTEDYVLKKVKGIPGDHLLIKNGQVFINQTLVASGFENAVLYEKKERDFEREEIIPEGKYFMVGTASLSNDSRYWGYLEEEAIVGRGYRVY